MGDLVNELRIAAEAGDCPRYYEDLMTRAANALAAQQDGVREGLDKWFNALPCDSIGKEHWDKLCQIVGLEQTPMEGK